MKTGIKTSLPTGLLLIALFVAAPAFAVEGTCSWHGGVDCSAGPDWDGSAICNDGWSDSGERYFEQARCEETPMCSQSRWLELSGTYEMRTDRARFSEIITRINTLNVEYPMIEIRIQEESVGRGVTVAGIAPIIRGAQKENRDEVTKLTYETKLLDKKLRDAQMEINKACIAIGVAMQNQEALAKEWEYYAPQRAALQRERAAAEVKKIDTGPEMTMEERCIRQGLGQFYNTDKQSCDTCPFGTERILGTNICQKPTPPAIREIPTVAEVKPQARVASVVEKQDTEKIEADDTATTSEETSLLANVGFLAASSAVKVDAPVDKSPSFWEKLITPIKSFWARIFR